MPAPAPASSPAQALPVRPLRLPPSSPPSPAMSDGASAVSLQLTPILTPIGVDDVLNLINEVLPLSALDDAEASRPDLDLCFIVAGDDDVVDADTADARCCSRHSSARVSPGSATVTAKAASLLPHWQWLVAKVLEQVRLCIHQRIDVAMMGRISVAMPDVPRRAMQLVVDLVQDQHAPCEPLDLRDVRLLLDLLGVCRLPNLVGWLDTTAAACVSQLSCQPLPPALMDAWWFAWVETRQLLPLTYDAVLDHLTATSALSDLALRTDAAHTELASMPLCVLLDLIMAQAWSHPLSGLRAVLAWTQHSAARHALCPQLLAPGLFPWHQLTYSDVVLIVQADVQQIPADFADFVLRMLLFVALPAALHADQDDCLGSLAAIFTLIAERRSRCAIAPPQQVNSAVDDAVALLLAAMQSLSRIGEDGVADGSGDHDSKDEAGGEIRDADADDVDVISASAGQIVFTPLMPCCDADYSCADDQDEPQGMDTDSVADVATADRADDWCTYV